MCVAPIVEADTEVYRVTIADGLALRVYEMDCETGRVTLVDEVRV